MPPLVCVFSGMSCACFVMCARESMHLAESNDPSTLRARPAAMPPLTGGVAVRSGRAGRSAARREPCCEERRGQFRRAGSGSIMRKSGPGLGIKKASGGKIGREGFEGEEIRKRSTPKNCQRSMSNQDTLFFFPISGSPHPRSFCCVMDGKGRYDHTTAREGSAYGFPFSPLPLFALSPSLSDCNVNASLRKDLSPIRIKSNITGGAFRATCSLENNWVTHWR